MERKHEEMEIDFIKLFSFLKKRVWIVALVVAVCAVLGLVFNVLIMTPKYTASTRVYILNRSSENNIVYADLQTSMQFLQDYTVLITGQNVTKEVTEKLGLSENYNQLASKIEVSAPENTRVLEISVTDEDPQMAADIANAVREVAAEQIKTIMGVDAVNLVYAADAPSSPSGLSAIKTAVIAAALGLVGSVGVLIVFFVLDDAIRTEEDVENYLGLSVLGVIPASDEVNDYFANGDKSLKKISSDMKR